MALRSRDATRFPADAGFPTGRADAFCPRRAAMRCCSRRCSGKGSREWVRNRRGSSRLFSRRSVRISVREWIVVGIMRIRPRPRRSAPRFLAQASLVALSLAKGEPLHHGFFPRSYYSAPPRAPTAERWPEHENLQKAALLAYRAETSPSFVATKPTVSSWRHLRHCGVCRSAASRRENTMFAAIIAQADPRLIGILRLMGFARWQILASFLHRVDGDRGRRRVCWASRSARLPTASTGDERRHVRANGGGKFVVLQFEGHTDTLASGHARSPLLWAGGLGCLTPASRLRSA